MSDSSSQKGGLRVAFQGELGAFSEEAVHRFFGEGVQPVPRREFADVGSAVVDGEVDFGLLPIENTLAGSVVGSYDVLAGGRLEIVGEVITPIHHCVMGLPAAELERVTRIISHPVALAQCTRFLRSRTAIEAVAVYDTAGAAREVAAGNDPAQAAIAGARAAYRYGLRILAENVEDRPDNQTRFFVVRSRSAPPAISLPPRSQSASKSSVLIETKNVPGALLQVLSPFAERGINLSKLESRPSGEPWTYRFFLEVDMAAADETGLAALEEIRKRSIHVHLLGSYPRWADA